MVQSPSDRLRPYWPANRPPVEQPMSGVPHDEHAVQPHEQAWTEWLADCMGQRPILTLATAAAVGLVVGWIVKRK